MCCKPVCRLPLTAQHFNARYAHRLLRLADKALYTVHDGVPHQRPSWPGGLRLQATYESEDSRGIHTYPTKVILLATQTEASLMRVLYAMFSEATARKVRAAWVDRLYIDQIRAPYGQHTQVRVPALAHV